MSNTTLKKIEVYADWAGMQNPMLVGELHAIRSRGKKYFHSNMMKIGFNIHKHMH